MTNIFCKNDRYIEEKREKLRLLVIEKGNGTDPQVVELSEEVNNLILPWQIKNIEELVRKEKKVFMG